MTTFDIWLAKLKKAKGATPTDDDIREAVAALDFAEAVEFASQLEPERVLAATMGLAKQYMVERDAALQALSEIADHVMTGEGDTEETETFFGVSAKEAVAMAHDNMIAIARAAIGAKEGE